ncbi:MAG TPA: ABC transporter ATP-binding protein, partial [Anaerolineae bacterium]
PNSFIEAFVRGLRWLRPAERFWALRDVSFAIPAGRMVGVIGNNGAGKSTLLRLIGGVGRPDVGYVRTHGRIGALLELGAGFHPDLTGRENVFVSGVISGLTRREVQERFHDIVAFAELEAFIENPLRTYSSGMQMRLAFAVAAHIEPDILLIDEVLAVGDVAFQRKCLDRIAQFKAQGCTVVLVSHEATLVRELCDEVLWLQKGQLVAQGAAEVVVSQYLAEMSSETQRRTPTAYPTIQTTNGMELRVNANRFGSLEMEITAVRLLNVHGSAVSQISSGSSLLVQLDYQAPEPISCPIFGVSLSREDGFICYDTNTAAAGLEIPVIQGKGQITLHLDRLDLMGGTYYLDIGVYEQNWRYAYDYHWHVYPLLVQAPGGERGVLRPPHRWQLGHVPIQAAVPTIQVRN